MNSETLTENYGDFKVVRCYMCNEPINVLKGGYNIVQINNEIDEAYNCRVSDDEVVAYLCDKCYDKIANIRGGEIY